MISLNYKLILFITKNRFVLLKKECVTGSNLNSYISNLNITKYSEILHFVGLRKPTGSAKIYIT